MLEFELETQDAASFLVYKKREQDVIDTIAKGMISNNKLEGIIPFVYVQVDDEVYFKYNISAKDTLKQHFSGTVKKKMLLELLGKLMDVFLLANDYMLETSSFVLDSSYIFVNANTSQLFLIVLPIIREADMQLADFVKELLNSVQLDPAEDGSYAKELFRFLELHSFFSAHDFKELTERLLREEQKAPAPMAKPKAEPQLGQELTVFPISGNDNAADGTKPNAGNKAEKKGLFGRKKGEKKREKPKKEKPTKEKPPKEKKPFFWKKGKKESGQETPTMLGTMAIPGSEPVLNVEPSAGEEQEKESPKRKLAVVPSQEVPMPNNVVQQQEFDGTIYVNHTAEEMENSSSPLPYLVDLRTKESFAIVKAKSKIGKQQRNNDFCIRGNNRVSREHAIIHLQDGQVFMEDNHSLNGTYVDGRAIQPGSISKALLPGMRIRLADEELEFRMK